MHNISQAAWGGSRRFGCSCFVGTHALLLDIVPYEHNSPMETGAKVAFELTSNRGAALITDHPTSREGVQLEGEFEDYIKKYYDSWVDFAREKKHGRDVKPVLVTGVDLTKQFATIAYSDIKTRMLCSFSVGAPAVGSASLSAWGNWDAPSVVHKNCGPTMGLIQGNRNQGSEGSSISGSSIPEDRDQCVFVRYYTFRKRPLLPRVLEARAGPHQLHKGDFGSDDAESAVVEISDDDSDGEGLTEVGHPEAGLEVIHNVPLVSPGHHPHLPLFMKSTKDDRNGFDVVAEFIFQVRLYSDALNPN